MDILTQLGGLVLGSVPTMIFFILLVGIYTVLVQRPLERTLAERRARTSGAVEQARSAIAAAEAETTAYEDKLRAARQEILADRERRKQARQQQRDATLATVREAAQAQVRAGRQQIDEAQVAARRQIEGATAQLSEQILKAVLPPGTKLAEATQ
jgi:F-type H+-transporting ATPase subunit b